MKRYKAYCLDIDGTLYRGEEPVEFAAGFVERLQQNGIEPFFVTNNASKTQEQLQQRLAHFGIRAQKDRIYSSAITAAKYISRWHTGKTVYAIGSDGLKEALESENIPCIGGDSEIVVTGLDWDINYEKLAQACLDIRNGALFLATNNDMAFPSERGLLPGNGAFTALIAASTDAKPVFLGKPESHMLEAIQNEYGFAKEEMVMVGDNYDTDIMAGIRYGIDTVHVNTGVSSMETVAAKENLPVHMIEHLGQWEI